MNYRARPGNSERETRMARINLSFSLEQVAVLVDALHSYRKLMVGHSNLLHSNEIEKQEASRAVTLVDQLLGRFEE